VVSRKSTPISSPRYVQRVVCPHIQQEQEGYTYYWVREEERGYTYYWVREEEYITRR